MQLNNYAKDKSKSYDGYRKIMFAFNSIIEDCYKYKLREWNLDYKNKPIIDIPKKKELLPDYLTEEEFNKLMNIKDYNQISKKSFGGDANYLKKVFKFFFDTGCRLKEPFVAKIHNLKNSQYIMYVLPDDAKAGGGVENTNRIIYITKEQKDFILDFQKKAKDKNYPMINIKNTENISKQFKIDYQKISLKQPSSANKPGSILISKDLFTVFNCNITLLNSVADFEPPGIS